MMTSLTSTIRRTTDKLAKIIGHMILRLIMITVVAAGVVALGNALGMSDYTSTTAAAPAAATPVEGPTAAAPAAPAVVTTPAVATPAEGPTETPSGELASGRTVLVGLRATEVSAALWNDLLDLDWHGMRADGTDDVIYAPLGLVIFDDSGTWTITVDGPARCENGATRACSGAEWVR